MGYDDESYDSKVALSESMITRGLVSEALGCSTVAYESR